jgi:predicted 2-oxoglutarate/Fe(II)-dependent dioxygenase YbiX
MTLCLVVLLNIDKFVTTPPHTVSRKSQIDMSDTIADPKHHPSPTFDVSKLIIDPFATMEDFNPAPNEPCFCGSGNTFGQCCGSTEAVRPPPFGLFMFENYLDKNTVDDLLAYARERDGQRLMVIDNNQSTPDNIVKVEDQRRIAERVDMGDRRQEFNDLVKTIFVDVAKKCVGQSLEWYESPDLMRYREGGYYVKHADSQNMDVEHRTWTKVIDRDLSILIYLNDDFEGGELSFYRLNYQIRPRAGAVVMFPSDHRYLHQAETVKKGVRYAIVSWGSLKGVPKVAQNPPDCAIYID